MLINRPKKVTPFKIKGLSTSNYRLGSLLYQENVDSMNLSKLWVTCNFSLDYSHLMSYLGKVLQMYYTFLFFHVHNFMFPCWFVLIARSNER